VTMKYSIKEILGQFQKSTSGNLLAKQWRQW